jgi:signal transduction histidine kinase
VRRALAIAQAAFWPLLAIALFAASIVEIALDEGGNGWNGHWSIAVAVAALATLPLALSARFPLAAAATLTVGAAVAIAAVAPGQAPFEPFVALLLGFFAVGAQVPSRRSVVAVSLLAVAGLGVAAAGLNAGASNTLPAVVLVVLAWGAGAVLARRAGRTRELEEMTRELSEERAERERAAVAGERSRIARELHDVIAHNLSVVVLHAEAGRRSLDDRERVAETLETIENVGRQTVDELRRLLGILRADEEPALAPPPSLLHLDVLADHVRRAGLDVDVTVSGERNGISPGLDVAAYRIVQEALTNALKHARATRATVAVAYGRDRVEIEVADDGIGAAAPSPADPGAHGLVGMRERTSLYGGTLAAGARETGGFAVRAVFPTGRREP